MGRITDAKLNQTYSKTSNIGRISLAKLREKEIIEEQKKERIKQGLPISVRQDRAEPTALGQMPRTILKPFVSTAGNIRNVGRIIQGKEEKDSYTSKYFGKVQTLGKVDISKSPFEKENLKTIKKSVLTGMEIAQYLNATGVAKKTILNLSKAGVLASKEVFKEWAKVNMPQLAQEGFFQGVTGTIGRQGIENIETGKEFSVKEALFEVGTSTAGNVILPSMLRGLFGAKASKVLPARGALIKGGENMDIKQFTRALKDKEILGRAIPEVGTPSYEYLVKTGRILPESATPEKNIIELEDPTITASRRKINEISKPEIQETPKTNIERKAFDSVSRQDFIDEQMNAIKKSKDINKNKLSKGKIAEIPKYTEKQLGKIWDEQHTFKQEIGTEVPTTSKKVYRETKETGVIESVLPEGKIESPSFEKLPEDITSDTTPKIDYTQKDLNNLSDYFGDDFEAGTLKGWSKEIRKLPEEEITKIVKSGQKTTENNIPLEAYEAVLKTIAEETDNINLIKELTLSPRLSKTAQGLSSGRIYKKGGVISDLQEIMKNKLKKFNKNPEQFNIERKKLVKQMRETLDKEIEDILSNSSKKDIDDIITNFKC